MWSGCLEVSKGAVLRPFSGVCLHVENTPDFLTGNA
jgi:hypothetical protein